MIWIMLNNWIYKFCSYFSLVIFTAGLTAIMPPFVCILVSYGHIGATILRVPSAKGICKALSTCGSHLSVVTLYYGAIIGVYFLPSSNSTNDSNIISSLMYTVVTPMLNPFIYSLRNKDMKGALRKLLSKRTYSSNWYLLFLYKQSLWFYFYM